VLCALFFPAVSSGPILKPQNFFSQLREKLLRAEGDDFAAGLYAISLGTAKKVLLADPLGTVVSNGWALGDGLTASAAWAVILGYSLQLYLDFSGYCDIASGCARLLGIRLPVNFDAPYRALSVGEFWKRWHMTLTAFLRECVYIPLGGSRRGPVRTCVNILIVYLISGLWHGAGWTFLVWGLLHGLAQVLERLWGPRRERLPKALQWAMTFLFVNLAWVFFQAPSLAAAGSLLRAAVAGGGGLPLDTLAAGVLDSEATALRTLLPAAAAKWTPGLVLLALFGLGLAVSLRRRSVIRRMEDFRPTLGRAAVCGGLLAWAALSFSSTAAFIYSNF
jgi:D-alanyl-lipoteichoic acid acyltransferase DltB (MBOAT superfamily)